LNYISVTDSMGLASTSLMKFALKCDRFGAIMQNNSYYPTKGH